MLFKITVTDTNKASKMKNREINRKGMLNLAKFKEDKTQCSTNKEDKKHFLHIPNNKYGKVDTKKLINLEHKSIEKVRADWYFTWNKYLSFSLCIFII